MEELKTCREIGRVRSRRNFNKAAIHERLAVKSESLSLSLTSFLHEAEQFVEELFPLGVVVDFVELKEKRRWRYHR